jgi:hypothetical protein
MHRDLVRNELQQGAPDMDKIHLSLQVLENLWHEGMRPEAQPIESFEAGVLAQSLVAYAKSRAVVDVSVDVRFNEAQKLVLDALLHSCDPANRPINPDILGNAPTAAKLEKDKTDATDARDESYSLGGLGLKDAIKRLNAATANFEFREILDERFDGYVPKARPKAVTKGVTKHGQMIHALTLREPVRTPKDIKDAICDRALDLDEARFVVAAARDRLSKVSADSDAGQRAKKDLEKCGAQLEKLRMKYTGLRKELLPLLLPDEKREFELQYPESHGLPS